MEDLRKEGQRLQPGKFPGLDGISNKIARRIMEDYPEKLLNLGSIKEAKVNFSEKGW